MKRLIVLAALLALAGCVHLPQQSTHNGKPCHPAGVWGDAMVTADGTACY